MKRSDAHSIASSTAASTSPFVAEEPSNRFLGAVLRLLSPGAILGRGSGASSGPGVGTGG
eukprot:CAMPEP_0172027944 /NCGR_PEP_ID=MMETSP1041-20130122/17279_1 /TAXON_ID=464988 /ORGANISM="Hemiselmis andersenii, Strain CCMP439" /LENGTH=59 /DNA_ID=CAMNT_0012683897 /DNA_START=26 /DNA_END=205 /DNA_ORIENTATION=+